MIGVVPEYKAFREHLAQNSEKIASLQLLSRIEDYLTKEFAGLILSRSQGATLPLLNFGKKADERRIDMALVDGSIADGIDKTKLSIWGFIEVKYLRNRHRFGTANAEDEHSEVFRSLHKQLRRMEAGEPFAGYNVRLRGGKGDTYGLVFASHVCRAKEATEQSRKAFLQKIVGSGKSHGFKTHNFKTPKLTEVYSDVPVRLLKAEYAVSLYVGLWRLDPDEACTCGCSSNET
jgi:hypothetical protein